MLKTALIGAGSISGVHLKFLKSRSDVEIVGICNTSKEKAVKRVQEFGGKAYTDFEHMLDEASPHAVWVCTPPNVRREPLLACATRKIPVFCEKPAECNLESAVAINQALAKKKAHVQVGYLFRSAPVIQTLREQIADDTIHLVQSLYSCNKSLQADCSSPVYNKKVTGGLLVEQATHNFDLLRYLFGEVIQVTGMASNPVHKKKGTYTIEEVISLSLKFANGTLASHCHSWVGDMYRNEIVVIGQKRVYRLNLFGPTLVLDIEGKATQLPISPDSAYVREDEIFLDMVKSNDWENNPSDYADAIKTLRLSLAADQAIL